jgi:protein-S-isoprenylcysteine O-methyltransferase Ste14
MTNAGGVVSGIRRAAVNFALGLWWLVFARAHFTAYLETRQLPLLLFTASETAIAILFLVRSPEQTVSAEWVDWAVAIAGTFAPLMFRPAPSVIDAEVGSYLMFAGAAVQLAAALSLNRSFGIVAANRGIKTQGMYRLVRHPIYLSYLFSFTGYLMSYASSANALVCTVAIACLVTRVAREERHLLDDIAYREYTKQVKWRLVPYLY